jgi:predicted AAA+ superfamily ATPase
VIDEVQYAPGLFRHLKTWIDSHRGRNGAVVLTGSQGFPLMERVSDSLAGRAAVIPFLGLSAAEWVEQYRGDPPDWPEFLWRGAYPALWASPPDPPDRDRWYQGYLATYLERDVRNLRGVGSLRDFERFLRACALRCGQLLNMAELGRDVGVSATTARDWMGVLVASGQVLLLEPYHRSLGKRLVKSPKLYMTDTGLASWLMGYPTAETLWSGPHAGAMFENHVVGQWVRYRDWHRPSLGLWFWHDHSGNEVDLLLETAGRLVAIECKRTERPGARDTRGVAKLREFYGPEAVAAAFVACTAREPHEVADGVTARSGWTAWGM